MRPISPERVTTPSPARYQAPRASKRSRYVNLCNLVLMERTSPYEFETDCPLMTCSAEDLIVQKLFRVAAARRAGCRDGRSQTARPARLDIYRDATRPPRRSETGAANHGPVLQASASGYAIASGRAGSLAPSIPASLIRPFYPYRRRCRFRRVSVCHLSGVQKILETADLAIANCEDVGDGAIEALSGSFDGG